MAPSRPSNPAFPTGATLPSHARHSPLLILTSSSSPWGGGLSLCLVSRCPRPPPPPFPFRWLIAGGVGGWGGASSSRVSHLRLCAPAPLLPSRGGRASARLASPSSSPATPVLCRRGRWGLSLVTCVFLRLTEGFPPSRSRPGPSLPPEGTRVRGCVCARECVLVVCV